MDTTDPVYIKKRAEWFLKQAAQSLNDADKLAQAADLLQGYNIKIDEGKLKRRLTVLAMQEKEIIEFAARLDGRCPAVCRDGGKEAQHLLKRLRADYPDIEVA